MRKEILIENLVGIIAMVVVVVGVIFSALWIVTKEEPLTVATSNTVKQVQTLTANSVSSTEVEQIYEKIAAEKAAEEKRISDEKARIEAKKQAEIRKEQARLQKIEREKQEKIATEKRIIAEKQHQLEVKKQAEAEKKRQAEATKKKAEAEKKRQAEDAKKKAEAEKKRQAEDAKEKAEAEKKRQAEDAKKKAEAEKKRQAEAAKKKAEAEKKRQAEAARAKQAILDSLNDDISARESAAIIAAEEAAKSKALERYGQAIKSKVAGRWVIPPKLPAGLKVLLSIKTATNGQVISVKIAKSSGNRAFDNSAIEAVKRASPLPMPNKVEWAKEFAQFDFDFNPEG